MNIKKIPLIYCRKRLRLGSCPSEGGRCGPAAGQPTAAGAALGPDPAPKPTSTPGRLPAHRLRRGEGADPRVRCAARPEGAARGAGARAARAAPGRVASRRKEGERGERRRRRRRAEGGGVGEHEPGQEAANRERKGRAADCFGLKRSTPWSVAPSIFFFATQAATQTPRWARPGSVEPWNLDAMKPGVDPPGSKTEIKFSRGPKENFFQKKRPNCKKLGRFGDHLQRTPFYCCNGILPPRMI